MERRREREERETRDENNPDDQVVEENDEHEDSGNRNIDTDMPSPRNVAQTLSGNSQNDEDSTEAREHSVNNDSTEDNEDQ